VSRSVNHLERILGLKRQEIEPLRPRAAELERRARERSDFRSLSSRLQRAGGELAVIAEIKRASPSAGLIAQSFDPAAIAQEYERTGADAVSVLTDEQFFQGQLGYVGELRKKTSLPLLRKDFILDEVQVAESAAAGADAVLLIVAALEPDELNQLIKAAQKYQLDALVEVHNNAELDRALNAGARIIGINNRDLISFDVDLSVTEDLSQQVPDNIVLVSESGIKTIEDVDRIRSCGIDAILVGEALMRRQISIADLRP
jgi:indole-3-glycerol phosphate synthase